MKKKYKKIQVKKIQWRKDQLEKYKNSPRVPASE